MRLDAEPSELGHVQTELRSCLFEEDREGIIASHYSQAECLSLCKAKEAVHQVGCLPWDFLTFLSPEVNNMSLPLCSGSQALEIARLIEDVTGLARCDCPGMKSSALMG